MGWAFGGIVHNVNVLHFYLFVVDSHCYSSYDSWIIFCNPSTHIIPILPVQAISILNHSAPFHLLITPTLSFPCQPPQLPVSCLWMFPSVHQAGTSRAEHGGQATILGGGQQEGWDVALLQRGNFGCKLGPAWLEMQQCHRHLPPWVWGWQKGQGDFN